MAYRLIDSHIWQDPDMQDLSKEALHLYLYFMLCPHSNQSGIAKVHPKTVEHESRIIDPVKILPELKGRVEYFSNNHYFFIVKFIKHQCKNPSFLKAGIKALKGIPQDIQNAWWNENREFVTESLGADYLPKNENDTIPPTVYPEIEKTVTPYPPPSTLSDPLEHTNEGTPYPQNDENKGHQPPLQYYR